jgi:preprotein translocase subunit SecA
MVYLRDMISLETFFKKSGNARRLKGLRVIAEQVAAWEPEVAALSDDVLRARTTQLQKKVQEEGAALDSIVPEAFAVVRETAKRVLGERHYDVQIMGGVVLSQHAIAEMRTGEGKTLVGTLPVYLNALLGKGVHVITVNDYLARRDAVWMGQVYAFLGLSVGVINNGASYLYDKAYAQDSEQDEERDKTGSFKVAYEFLRPCTRKEAYEADITYGTNSEFGFDYLRDNIEHDVRNLRQRGHHFALIDEVDSVLIDEARTPLIISSPTTEGENLYVQCSRVADTLAEGEDYTKDEKMQAVQLLDSGIEKAEKALGFENIYTDAGIKYVHHLETAVRAKALYTRDKHYVVRDGEVVIVDTFTGRMQPGRRWSDGLHQAIEAKEGVPVQRESRTFASVTYQNYFRMYEKLAGMTGTAETSAEEFYTVYKLDVVQVPTHRTVQRIDRDDFIFASIQGKYAAIVKKVQEVHETGQPILIGTASVEENERLHQLFVQASIPHETLNAKNHEREGEVVAQAGRKGAVTIATNMAGRGVDIKLGGSPYDTQKADEVRALGGLFVLGTERHEARRIDNQLRGRSGRQGDPGETQFYVSLDDDLMRVFGNNTMIRGLISRATQAEDEPIQHKMITRSLETAQKRIEGFHFDARKQTLAYDDVLNKQRHALYEDRQKYLRGDREALEQVLVDTSLRFDAFVSIVSEKKETLGEEEFYRVLQRLCLQVVDILWLEHIETMDYLRSSVRLRAYGQRDPLTEYRKEGLRLYRTLQEEFFAKIVDTLPKVGAGAFLAAEEQLKRDAARAQAEGTGGVQGAQSVRSAHQGHEYGRNDKIIITNGTDTREMKYKKAEELLKSGAWKVVERN